MACGSCGAAKLTVSRENVKYDASGLPGVTLMNLEVRRCEACGDYAIVIPRILELHRLMAETVIRKPAPLTPAEIRFLRKHIGWSAVDFAKRMGTTPESVSRWENGKLPMAASADRLLRLMVVTTDPVDDYSLDVLTTITPKRTTKPLRVGMKFEKSGWKATAA